MIAVDLSKQQLLDSDPRAIRQINFTENSNRVGNTRTLGLVMDLIDLHLLDSMESILETIYLIT